MAFDRHAVHGNDMVLRLDPGRRRRHAVHRADHLDQPGIGTDLDADTAEMALGADLELPAKVLGVHIGGMGVEP